MAGLRETVREATASAVDFTRDAMRRLWGVQALAAVGVAVAFVALRGRMAPADAAGLFNLGCWTVLITAAPLWAGLYRFELGGEAGRELGQAGFQFGMSEVRMMILAAAFVAAAALFWLPVVAASTILFVLLRLAGEVVLGALGAVQVSFLIVVALWLAALASFVWICARCAFAPAATVGERRLVLREAWDMGRGHVGAVLAAAALVQAPGLLTLALLALIDPLMLNDPSWGVRGRWSLPDASLGGLLLGLVFAFVHVPMTVGVLGHLYRTRNEAKAAAEVPVQAQFEPELLTG